MIKKMIVVFLAMLGFTVMAATDSVFTNSKGAKIAYNSKGDIVRGEWTSQFNKARKQAEAEGVPLVIFWANNGCGHCAAVEVAMDSSGFRNWMKEKKLYMVFACGGYPGPCGKTDLNDGTAAAKSYAKDPSGEFPYIGVWWNNGGTSLKKRGTFTGNGKTAAQVESGIMNLLKGYKPCVGGWFADLEQGESRYEIEPTTKQVELILARDSKNKAAGDDEVKLSKTMSGVTSTVKTYKATWAKNAATTSLIVAVPDGFKAGDKLTAVINGETKAKYKCTVYCVAAKANSAGNPDWGETIEFGKWTADFVGATNFVAQSAAPQLKTSLMAASPKAYTLVSVQGSLWCPDCANTERNFLDLEGGEKFKAWAKSHNVALVSMDIPNYSAADANGMASPTLFSRVAAPTALARANEYPGSGAEASMTNKIYRSGLSYLTRKGILSADAAAQKELFKVLASKNTDEGGFHRPEDSNKFRTGVPIFVLLRADGTVAARLTRLASVSPKKADQANFDNYIKRFEEMLAIADGDATEIGNNYPSKDSIALKLDGSAANGEISNADFQDSFKLEGNGAAVIKATVSGASDAEVIAQFMQESDGELANVGEPVTGKLSSGLTVEGDFETAGACYLLVKGKDITAAAFKVESAGSTLQAFKVTAKATSLNPQQVKSSVPVKAGEEITLRVDSGSLYRIVGATPSAEHFEAQGNDLYQAKVQGDASVKASAAGTLEFQEWVAAKVGFASSGATVDENKGVVKVAVKRTGGVSGSVKVTVSLDKDNTTFYYDHDDKTLPRFWINGQTAEPYFESVDFEWGDGENEDKVLEIKLEQDAELQKYYGNGKIALAITDVESDADDAESEQEDYTLTVKETSKNTKSKISALKADPVWDYKAVVYARKSAGVDVELSRSDVGDVLKNYIIVKSSTTKAVVKAGEGNTLFRSGNKQYWGANDYTNKLVHVDLKKMSSGSAATITLTEKKDSKKKLVSFAADSSNKSVKIYAIADDAPSFVTNKVGTFKYVTYSYCKESVAFDTAFVKNANKLSVALVKGSLPPGVKAVVSNGRLYFKGVPTKAGSFAAYYQAREKRGTKTVKGLVVKAAFRIVDPTTVKSTDANYGHLVNTSVKSSRTFNSLIVTGRDETANRVAGTLNVTIPKSGKISAKYVNRKASVSFSATRWAKKSFDDPDGTLRCSMTSSGYKLDVEAQPDGTVIASIENDPLYPDQEVGTVTAGKVWSSSASAKAWKGIYNAALVPGGTQLLKGNSESVVLSGAVVQPTVSNEFGEAVFMAPTGYGYVNFKMTSKTAYEAGKMTWAGKLPNGQSISGTAYLTKGVTGKIGQTGFAYLPVFKRLTEADDKSKDMIALAVEIKSNAAKEGGLRYVQGSPDLYPEDPLFDVDGEGGEAPSEFPLGAWAHTGVSGTGTDYGMDLHLFGSYYDPVKDLRTCCDELQVPVAQQLQVLPPTWAGSTSKKIRCEAGAIGELDIKVGKNTLTITSASNPSKFTITLNRDTGVLSGTLRVSTADKTKLSSGKSYAEATWTGVMTTGWGSECGCVEDDSLTLPFICGSLKFTDEIPYLTKSGSTKIVKQLSGGKIYSGAKAE